VNYPDDFVNKIAQGDCRKLLPYLPDNSVDLIIIDPPYVLTNQKWDYEVIDEQFAAQLLRVLKPTGNLYIWCGIGEKSQSLIRWFPIFQRYFQFKDLITWKKNRGIGMRKGWLYTREECMWFVKDNTQFIWNKEAQYSTEKRPWNVYKKGGKMVNKSEYKRFTNVWTDINEVGFGSCPKNYKSERWKFKHFTPKPIEAIERIINAHTKKNDLVLDCFLGSGTTAMACKNLNRKFIGIELEEEYCKIARQRLL
jgi:site-specific DNA-methyltransferase (adenine-specific)